VIPKEGLSARGGIMARALDPKTLTDLKWKFVTWDAALDVTDEALARRMRRMYAAPAVYYRSGGRGGE